MQELFGTSQPFEIVWSFRATNLSTNTRVPVVVDASAEPTEVRVQQLNNKIPNGRIEVTFPAQPEDNIYEFEATAEITDANGFINIIRHRLWSHDLSSEPQQLEDGSLPAVAELASESADDIVSASTSDISGSPRDEVDLPDNIIAKFRNARMLRSATIDNAEDKRLSIDELRHLIRGARMFEPDDPACLGVPATIVGTDGGDLLMGTATDDVIVGMGGDDIVCGDDGSDVVMGGTGEDIVDGGVGSDELRGGPDSDELGGSPGNDMIDGGAGNDLIDSGPGSDTCINDETINCP